MIKNKIKPKMQTDRKEKIQEKIKLKMEAIENKIEKKHALI